jgi:hypothetical protein
MAFYSPDQETYIIRSLQNLRIGQEAQQADLDHLTGEIRSCLDALQMALQMEGETGLHSLWYTLSKNRPWLKRLASMTLEDRQLTDIPARRVRFLSDEEFENRPQREWLIPKILPREGIALIFGVPGCGKSFLTIAWSLCIATGTPWLDHEVLQGPVAYIAAEGGFGLGPRIKAWKAFQQVEGDSGVRWFDQTLALQDAGNFNELLTAFAEDFKEPPVLVVIDTLSRCSGGADENSNTDMAKIIASADILQRRFHCTVLIVHHAGKDNDRGPRGASALIGNTETIIEVAKTEMGCRLACYKQKDAPGFEPFVLAFQSIRYNPDTDESSAVLIRGNDDDQPTLNNSETAMMTILNTAEKPLTYSEWVHAALEAGLKERTATRAIKNLMDARRAEKKGNLYMPPMRVEQEEMIFDDFEL